jgi:hypothetical protein
LTAWRNSRHGVICVSARSSLGQGRPPPRRRCGMPRAVRWRRTLTIETSTRRPRHAVPRSVARPLAKRSALGTRLARNGRYTRARENCGNVVTSRCPRRSSPLAGRAHRLSPVAPPCTFPGRTTLASNTVRTVPHAQIDGLSRVFAWAQPRRNAFEQVRRAQRETVERPCHVGITGCRGLLRRLARRTRLNDDAVTRVIDRKCAAVQELRRANQGIRGAAPREIVAETFHRPCNRSATTRPPTCKNA